MSIVQFDRTAISVSWCERNWGENKMPLGRGGGVNSLCPWWGGGKNTFSAGRALDHLYPRAFCTLPSFARIKGPRSTSTIARKNRGLWTVYPDLDYSGYHKNPHPLNCLLSSPRNYFQKAPSKKNQKMNSARRLLTYLFLPSWPLQCVSLLSSSIIRLTEVRHTATGFSHKLNRSRI